MKLFLQTDGRISTERCDTQRHRDGAGVEVFPFVVTKTETVRFKNRLPALTHGYIHRILCCLTKTVWSDWWGVRVEARSGFGTRLTQWGGGGREHCVPALTLNVLSALVRSPSLEVRSAPKTATQHARQQPRLSLTLTHCPSLSKDEDSSVNLLWTTCPFEHKIVWSILEPPQEQWKHYYLQVHELCTKPSLSFPKSVINYAPLLLQRYVNMYATMSLFICLHSLSM